MSCCTCFRLPASRAGPSTLPSVSKRRFATSSPSLASPVDVDLTFPRKLNPTPFEIFHLSRDEPELSPKAIKSRYLELVRIYHPDRRPRSSSSSGKGKVDDSAEFKQITAAYELLSDENRRSTYLRTGLGWGSTSGFAGGSGGPASPWSQSTAEYHFRRGRPMSSNGGRWSGTYDHWSYTSWTDPYNPHFRTEEAGGVSGNGAAAGWEGKGAFGTNGAIFLALASLTLVVTPMTAWYAVTSAPPESLAATGPAGSDTRPNGWVPRVYDRRHEDAARNLHLARLEAKTRGQEKREALKRRVRQIEREKAFDRAKEVEAIERTGGTGHLSLPAPS
ncbi:hypothetical protein JCM21900_000932 [Sporobolomyces salmonicolor]